MKECIIRKPTGMYDELMGYEEVDADICGSNPKIHVENFFEVTFQSDVGSSVGEFPRTTLSDRCFEKIVSRGVLQ